MNEDKRKEENDKVVTEVDDMHGSTCTFGVWLRLFCLRLCHCEQNANNVLFVAV